MKFSSSNLIGGLQCLTLALVPVLAASCGKQAGRSLSDAEKQPTEGVGGLTAKLETQTSDQPASQDSGRSPDMQLPAEKILVGS